MVRTGAGHRHARVRARAAADPRRRRRSPHDQGLAGHSDADVLTHAVIDALLGAAGLGDIGAALPRHGRARGRTPTRSRCCATVVAQLGEAGWAIGNVDATVVLERPKLAPHRDAIRATLAAALGLPADAVNVKATTGEGMGFVGRGEGAAAMAVATLDRA